MASVGRARLRPGLCGACGPAGWLCGWSRARFPGWSLPGGVCRARVGAVAPELRNRPAGDRGGNHAEQAAGPGGEPRATNFRRGTGLRVAEPRAALKTHEEQAVDPALDGV